MIVAFITACKIARGAEPFHVLRAKERRQYLLTKFNRGVAAVQTLDSLVGLMPDQEVRNSLERGEYFHLLARITEWANNMGALLPAGVLVHGGPPHRLRLPGPMMEEPPPVPRMEEIDLADGGQEQEDKNLARPGGGD
jgi:hypothetical protein